MLSIPTTSLPLDCTDLFLNLPTGYSGRKELPCFPALFSCAVSLPGVPALL
ncbi:MAG: hypothetical protein VX904_03285 [Planctomycetota bacterium]|nr:hypothetical protein [Planctomycetota bacterium]